MEVIIVDIEIDDTINTTTIDNDRIIAAQEERK